MKHICHKWTPCTEALPVERNLVLIWYRCAVSEWRVSMGEHVSGHWRPEGGNGNFDDYVTHWMPLPEPPTDTNLPHKKIGQS